MRVEVNHLEQGRYSTFHGPCRISPTSEEQKCKSDLQGLSEKVTQQIPSRMLLIARNPADESEHGTRNPNIIGPDLIAVSTKPVPTLM